MKKQLKIGFIGGGLNSAVGNTHRIASQMDNRWTLTAGCFSTNTEINRQTAETWNVKTRYEKWIELLENEKKTLDAVAILTPTNIHFEMIIKALELGYPVICEKSLSSTCEEAVSIAETADKHKSFITVINNYTGYPMLRELKEMIRQGRLGKIKHIQVEMPQEGFIRYINENKKPKPQSWRLKDGDIPTVYLDLGIHLHHIISFLCGGKPLDLCAVQDSHGFFENIIDNVSCIANYQGGIRCQIWFGKSALGHRNGLKVRIYGDEGSAEWLQMEPEIIKFSSKKGMIEIIDNASPGITVANQARYNRFKSGHPAGFIEAFANYYYDIADELISYQTSGKYSEDLIISGETAKEGLSMLNAMVVSSKTGSWESVK